MPYIDYCDWWAALEEKLCYSDNVKICDGTSKFNCEFLLQAD